MVDRAERKGSELASSEVQVDSVDLQEQSPGPAVGLPAGGEPQRSSGSPEGGGNWPQFGGSGAKAGAG